MTPEEFRAFRLKLGCEYRSEIAEQMGVTRRCIEHWEYGRRRIPLWAEKLLKCLLVAQLAEKELGIKDKM